MGGVASNEFLPALNSGATSLDEVSKKLSQVAEPPDEDDSWGTYAGDALTIERQRAGLRFLTTVLGVADSVSEYGDVPTASGAIRCAVPPLS